MSFSKRYPRVSRAIEVGGKVARIATQAYGMATTIAALVNAEKKYKDKVFPGTNISTTASWGNLTDMAQGTTESTRNGNSLLSKSIQAKGYAFWNNVGAAQQLLRMIIVRDAENTDGLAPSISDLLEDVSSASNMMISPYNMDNVGRFHVIQDKLIALTQENQISKVKLFHKFPMLKDKKGNRTKGIHCKFNAGTTTAWAEGQVWMLLVSNSASNGPGITYYSRYRYMDN